MTLPERSVKTPSTPPPRMRLLPGAPGARMPRNTGRGGPGYGQGKKRLLSLLVLAPALPAALLLAGPIALVNLILFRDPRRILFRQPRVGRGGRVFSIWKFRTMREVEDAHFESWCDGRDGLRVTAFGRLLRNTHLDELPQLWNVLRGDMDLVGPRPEMVEIHAWAAELIPGFERRLAVRPGLTGLAQITQGYTGKDERAYRHKLAADLRYLRTLSVRRDLAILLRTLIWMLEGKGWIPRGRVRRPEPSGGKQGAGDGLGTATIGPWPPAESSSTTRSRSTTPVPLTPSVPND